MPDSADIGSSRPLRHNPESRTEELLAQVADRNMEALASLYDHFAPSLMGILVRILSARLDAESALEEVFLRLWREAPGLAQTQGSLAAWLVLMARHIGVERVRAQRALAAIPVPSRGQQGHKTRGKPASSGIASRPGERRPGEQAPSGRDSRTGRLAVLPSGLPRPEDIALAEARLDLLQRAFDQMPKPQRRALELVVFEAYNESEVASQLGEPLGKVSAGLRAAFTFLRHRQQAVLGTWTADI